jgi:hypothetical protein
MVLGAPALAFSDLTPPAAGVLRLWKGAPPRSYLDIHHSARQAKKPAAMMQPALIQAIFCSKLMDDLDGSGTLLGEGERLAMAIPVE